MDKLKDLRTEVLEPEGGNMVRFQARRSKARIHLEGTGTIQFEVSVNGIDFDLLEKTKSFSSGKAIVPLTGMNDGDWIRITATTITSAIINW